MHPKVFRLFSLWDLIWENTSSDRKSQGKPPKASWPGDVPTPSGPGKSIPPYCLGNLRKDIHSFWQLGSSLSARRLVWVTDWKKEPLQPVWTDPHMVIQATPTDVKVTGTSLGSTTPESRRQWLPVMRTPGKLFGTQKIPRSGSKNNSPHSQRMLSPALVTSEAD